MKRQPRAARVMPIPVNARMSAAVSGCPQSVARACATLVGGGDARSRFAPRWPASAGVGVAFAMPSVGRAVFSSLLPWPWTLMLAAWPPPLRRHTPSSQPRAVALGADNDATTIDSTRSRAVSSSSNDHTGCFSVGDDQGPSRSMRWKTRCWAAVFCCCDNSPAAAACAIRSSSQRIAAGSREASGWPGPGRLRQTGPPNANTRRKIGTLGGERPGDRGCLRAVTLSVGRSGG